MEAGSQIYARSTITSSTNSVNIHVPPTVLTPMWDAKNIQSKHFPIASKLRVVHCPEKIWKEPVARA